MSAREESRFREGKWLPEDHTGSIALYPSLCMPARALSSTLCLPRLCLLSVMICYAPHFEIQTSIFLFFSWDFPGERVSGQLTDHTGCLIRAFCYFHLACCLTFRKVWPSERSDLIDLSHFHLSSGLMSLLLTSLALVFHFWFYFISFILMYPCNKWPQCLSRKSWAY